MSCTNLCFKFSKNINVTEIIVKYIAFSPPKHSKLLCNIRKLLS